MLYALITQGRKDIQSWHGFFVSNRVSNYYGDVDWSAPLVTVYGLALIAVDEKSQNKVWNHDGSNVIKQFI